MKNINELKILLKNCIKIDPSFGMVLASGKKSDFYIDCKKIVLDAYGINLLGNALFWELKKLIYKNEIQVPKFVAGTPLGGIPMATAVSFASVSDLRLNNILVRKEKKQHGTGKMIEFSENLDNKNVVIFEDVITTGTSSLRCAQILENEGFNPLCIMSIVDREEGGRDAIEKCGLKFFSLFLRSDF